MTSADRPRGPQASGERAQQSEPRVQPAEPQGQRLQKVMAAAGVASRRASEELIAAGRVRVNGVVVTEPGRRVDPGSDRVVVDGVPVQVDTSRRYVMLNKPTGIVSTLRDEHGRPDLRRFTDRFEQRLFNVGRLDSETSGLLLLTNDGELAHVLAHPSFGVTKTYIARVRGQMKPQTVATLTRGIELDDGPITADKARLLERGSGGSLVELTLHSGRNRIVRRMLAAVGHPVTDLVRRRFGPLNLGSLPLGQTRDLTRVEVGELLTLARSSGDAPVPREHKDAGREDAGRDSTHHDDTGQDGVGREDAHREDAHHTTAHRNRGGREHAPHTGTARHGNARG